MKKTIIVVASLWILTLASILTLDVHNFILASNQLVIESHRRIVDTSQNVNAALIQIGLATDQLQQASREQRSYWSINSRRVTTSFDHLDNLIIHADDAVVAINKNATLTATTASDSLRILTTELEPVVVNASKTLDNLNSLAGDGNLKQIIANTNATTKNVADATEHLSKAAGDVEIKVHQMTKPASVAVKVGMFILDLGFKLRGLIGK